MSDANIAQYLTVMFSDLCLVYWYIEYWQMDMRFLYIPFFTILFYPSSKGYECYNCWCSCYTDWNKNENGKDRFDYWSSLNGAMRKIVNTMQCIFSIYPSSLDKSWLYTSVGNSSGTSIKIWGQKGVRNFSGDKTLKKSSFLTTLYRKISIFSWFHSKLGGGGKLGVRYFTGGQWPPKPLCGHATEGYK